MLSGFWYFNAQKNSLENNIYYKLQHLADKVSGLIIHAQMTNTPLMLPKSPKHYEYILIGTSDEKVFDQSYFEEGNYKVLVSSAPQKHLAVKYVVVKTDEYYEQIEELKKDVLLIMSVVFFAIMVISWFLSRFFMQPIHEKVVQIETFIKDISHELNTPITALQMSSKRAIQKKVYDEKILRNISISTKQLYSIYQSLTYLSFNMLKQEAEFLDLKPIVQESIEYYKELVNAKNIYLEVNISSVHIQITKTKAELLFSNLLSNAIKYSMPNTTIKIVLKEGCFSIEDQGVGIEKEKLKEIFGLYKRGSNIAGGFGVGLHIVKQICNEYHIQIEVDSEAGKGSIFKLKLM